MGRSPAHWAGAIGILALVTGSALAQEPLKIGSKRFTESYILGELLVRAASGKGPAVHRAGLGNTGILYAALRAGSIDVYPEYSGTIAREILGIEGRPGLEAINVALQPVGLAASIPLGFNNSYALGMRDDRAERLGIRTITDLAAHSQLKLGFSQEFLARSDGWPGLAKAYGLASLRPVGLDHGLAYEALAAQRVDVIDLYSTDAKIARYRVRVLEDDRAFFPRYEALLLHRADVPSRFAPQWQALSALQHRLGDTDMIRLNAAAELEGRTFADAAALFFNQAAPAAQGRSFLQALLAPDLARLTYEHIVLVFGSLVVSILIGVPLGVAAFRYPALEQPVFALVGIVQTIPSLALLAFLIAVMGTIGMAPAVVALLLYALLPIVRNTHAGLAGVGEGMRQAAVALGLSARDRLFFIELPLARPYIVAGIKTSAVINVGTATIAAFIGAGGYGDRISSGLALNDTTLLLAGAVPAALLALLTQAAFEQLERWADPLKGLAKTSRAR